jgi:hypothetical protein
MFGKINTKTDHAAAFRRSIDLAITAGKDANIGTRVIASYLQERAKAIEDAAYMSPSSSANTIPRMVDGYGKPIDMAKQIEDAQRERQRRIDAACEIPRDQRQVAASGYRVP